MSKKNEQQFTSSKMMLPEHRCGLQKHSDELRHSEERRRPMIDEQMQEEYQRLLNEALFHHRRLKLIILKSDGRHYITGMPLRMDPTTGIILLDTGLLHPFYVSADEVISVSSV
ncbi:MAG: YolD-like family protein [Bacillota bacterium]|nr:YolD-like family protein [Bacillota bacterium]